MVFFIVVFVHPVGAGPFSWGPNKGPKNQIQKSELRRLTIGP
jgi:hypothetical protein